MSYLELDEVGVRYSGGAAAVQGAKLSLDLGECAVVLGPNGAGKTSLVRAISGFQRHENVTVSGAITLEGSPLGGVEVSRRARRGVAYIPERDKVFRELTVSENLEIFAQRRRRKQGIEQDTAFAMDVFPALERLPSGRPAGLLSGGEQQMLAIAGAMISAPSLLIVDEPSLGLAPILVLDMMRALGRIVAERHVALLLVDQNVRSTRQLANKIYTMHSGQLVHETGPDVHDRLIRDGYARRAS